MQQIGEKSKKRSKHDPVKISKKQLKKQRSRFDDCETLSENDNISDGEIDELNKNNEASTSKLNRLSQRANRIKYKKNRIENELTVFVGNLPQNITKQELKQIFIHCGPIKSCRLRCAKRANPKLPKKAAVIKKDFHASSDSINAFVCFQSSASAKKALKFNGTFYNGHHLRVDEAASGGKYDSSRSVFIGNLAFGVKDEAVYEHFKDCGDVEAVRIIRDQNTGMGKGFGYVLFKDSASSQLALRLNESDLEGRKIRVSSVVKHNKPTKFTKIKTTDNTLKKRSNDENRARPKRQLTAKSLQPIGRKFDNVKLSRKRKLKSKPTKSLIPSTT